MFSATKRFQIRGSADQRTRKSRDARGKKDNGDENQLLRLVKSNNITPRAQRDISIKEHTSEFLYLKDQFIVSCQKVNKTENPFWRGREGKNQMDC